jgi:hypothetical protein
VDHRLHHAAHGRLHLPAILTHGSADTTHTRDTLPYWTSRRGPAKNRFRSPQNTSRRNDERISRALAPLGPDGRPRECCWRTKQLQGVARERIEIIKWNNEWRGKRLSELPDGLQEFMEDYVPKFIPANRPIVFFFDIFDIEEKHI